MKKVAVLFASLFAAALLLMPSASTQEGGPYIYVYASSLSGVKCRTTQRALWIIRSGGSAGVYRCSATDTFTAVGNSGTVTGTGTAGRVPYWSSATALGDSPLLRADANTVRQVNTTNSQKLEVYNTSDSNATPTNYERLVLMGNGGFPGLFFEKGGTGAAREMYVRNTSNAALRLGTNGTDRWVIEGSGHLNADTDNAQDVGASGATRPRRLYLGTGLSVEATVTAGGTTGAQTINKTAGAVNFAAGASSLVVTNSTVTANSIILCTVQTDDATALIKNCVPAAGSFTIRLNANATGETRVAFWVVEPD